MNRVINAIKQQSLDSFRSSHFLSLCEEKEPNSVDTFSKLVIKINAAPSCRACVYVILHCNEVLNGFVILYRIKTLKT